LADRWPLTRGAHDRRSGALRGTRIVIVSPYCHRWRRSGEDIAGKSSGTAREDHQPVVFMTEAGVRAHQASKLKQRFQRTQAMCRGRCALGSMGDRAHGRRSGVQS
jgi:hypothetical protein